jgi:transposase
MHFSPPARQPRVVSLATKSATGEELESDRLKAKLGAALIERDLLHEKIAVLEANRPLSRRTFRS